MNAVSYALDIEAGVLLACFCCCLVFSCCKILEGQPRLLPLFLTRPANLATWIGGRVIPSSRRISSMSFSQHRSHSIEMSGTEVLPTSIAHGSMSEAPIDQLTMACSGVTGRLTVDREL